MKNYTYLFFFLFLVLSTLTSCSSSDSIDQEEDSKFPMTAKVNGELFQMTNPFGTNEATSSIYGYYPNSQYIQLQGRPKLDLNALSIEVIMWINRDDLKIGTYPVSSDTEDVATHIDLIDLRNDDTGVGVIYESTISGAIKITFVDEINKIVKGTFEFNAIDDTGNSSPPVNSIVTEGTFNYKYN